MSGSIVDVGGIAVGSVQDASGLTGCTAILFGAEGAVCGVDVRGGGPATHETDLLDPAAHIERVHAIVLSGGSAFGLESASGVAAWLREQGIGVDAAGYRVPIVPAAALFDLPFSGGRTPDRALGYAAAQRASNAPVIEGNTGAGAGATVGKIRGAEFAMKGGLGSAAIRHSSGLVVGAIVAVNALGSIIDPQSGAVLAGPRDENGIPQDTAQYIIEHGFEGRFAGNTTIGVVATNAVLTKAQAKKIAAWSHDAYARTIAPAHTMFDGDTVFAVSTATVQASFMLTGTLAVEALARAVTRAVTQTHSAGGLPAYREITAAQEPPA